MVAAVRRAQSWWRTHPVWGWTFVGVLAVALVVGVFVLPALGDVTPAIYPSGLNSSSAQAWVTEPTANNWATYLDAGGDENRAMGTNANSWFLADMDTYPGGTNTSSLINSVTVYASAKSSSGANQDSIQLLCNGSTYVSATQGPLSTTYASYSAAWTTNPVDSQPWDWTDIGAITAGVKQITAGSAEDIYVTQMWIVIDYTPFVATTVTAGDNAASDPAAADVNLGAANVVVDAFSLQRTAGNKASSINTLTVTKTGTAAITAVDIYSDANGNGVIDGTDASIGTGTFTGNTSTVDITDQTIDGTLKYYTIVYDFSAAAADLSTTTGEISAATYTNVDTFTDSDNAGSTFTVRYTLATLGDNAASDPAAANVTPGQLNVSVDAFSTQRTQGSKAATLNTVTVTKTGTATISAVDIYSDANGNGIVDGADATIGTGTFTGATAVINITDQTVDGTTRYYTVVYDIDGASTDAQTTTAEITAATHSNIDTLTESDNVGSTFTIVGPAQVTIGDGTDPTGGNISPNGAQYVDTFTIERTGGSAAATVTDVTLTKTAGTSAPTGFIIYADGNANGTYEPATDTTSIGSGTFSGDSSTVNITDQTVGAVGVPARYFVVYDLAAATNGQTFDGYVTAAVGSGTPAPVFTYSDNSPTFTAVLPTVVTVGDGTVLSTPVNVIPGETNVVIDAFTLSKTGPQTPVVTTLTVTKTGTALVQSPEIWIYRDSGTIGQFDGADNAIGSGSFGSPITLTSSQTIDATKTYIIVVRINASATAGTSVTGRVTAAAGTSVDSFTYADTTSRTANVVWPATTVAIGNGTADPGPGNVAPNATGVSVDRFRIERTGGTQIATVDTLTVSNAGSAPLTNARVYTDTNNDGSTSGETLLGSAAFSGATASVDITNEALGALGVPAYYIVACDVGAASDAQTIIVTVTAATGSGTPVPTFTYTDTANTFTILTVPDTEAPSIPVITSAAAGVASPTIATITWSASTDNVGVTGYEVFRSTTVGGTYASIGTTALLTFDDTTGIPGQEYFYTVRARDAVPNWSAQSTPSAGVTALWTPAAVPHDSYTTSTELCMLCHDVHQAATARAILKDFGGVAGELTVCYSCHDGSGATLNIKTGADNAFSLTSGHTLEDAETATDLTNACSACHSPHRDYDTNPLLAKTVVNGVAVSSADNTWCLACHNDGDDWYESSTPVKVYPSEATPTRDATTGYPTVGTFPGQTVYNTPAANAHVSIPAEAGVEREAGDCLYCHDSHRTTSAYDGLIAQFEPAAATAVDPSAADYDDYATLCFQCHGTNTHYAFATPPAGATNIQQFVMSNGTRSGHRIKTAGGTLPVGAPLPCYDCHNPHGSASGNKTLFSDELGASLETTTIASPTVAQAAKVRQFCFTCHTTAGDVASGDGLAYGWDSSGAGAYTTAIAAGKTVQGLARDAAVGANVVRLPAVSGHYRDDDDSCYKCHGGNYGSATGNNVHNPSGGVSLGGEACYGCHTQYQTYMEDDAGSKQGGPERLTVYHHVMGEGIVDGDFAPVVAADLTGYPDGFGGGMYCLTCHVDHDKFNTTPGANLRRNAVSHGYTAPYAINTDFEGATAPFAGGLCTSCHAIAVPRDTTNQLQAGTQTIVQSVDPAAYTSSAHQYKVSSEFGAGNTFQADCSKCHNDEQAKEFQTSTDQFGTHWSAERSLLTALGATASDPMGETHCYGCHTGTGAGTDGYGVQPEGADMTATARSVEAQFGLTSRHPVVPSAGNSVECVNCHNPHEVRATSPVSDPDNTYTAAGYSTDAERSAFCLKCHDGTLPTYTVGGTLVPSTVTIAATDANKSTYGTRGHWSTTGAISAAEQVACAECHDNHGSNTVKLLGVYDSATGTNKIGTQTITANDNTVCYACHTGATANFPAGEAQRDASGYLNTGTWPGSAVYTVGYNATNHTGSPHTAAEATNGFGAGDCKNCHDVHGTQYAYDELTGQFDPTSVADDDFALCFDCHDGTKGADIGSLYPTVAGGSNDSARSGHRVLSSVAGATLAQNQAVPCYDCHNPHGSASSYSLQVRDVGDEAGDAFDMITPATRAQNVANFCFTCHVPSDANEGWGDTGAAAGWVALTTEAVEGIARTNAAYKLKLPALDDHKKLAGADCLSCHTDPHEPSGGISNGGVDCYACHKSYQETMDADGTSKTAAYHHVMGTGGGTYNGDTAFASGAYPGAGTDVYCMSCHVDHDTFNSDKATNLRADLTATSAGASTDYVTSGSYGVCVGCHSSARAKDRTNQANDGLTGNVPAISGALYGTSAHQYTASSTFDDASVFTANCVKCHDDAGDEGYQSGNVFGTHASTDRRIVSALGGTPLDATAVSETNCYGCHTGGTAGNDYYGAKAMTQAARRIEGAFGLASSHPVDGNGVTSTVECVNCHNAHTVTAASPVSDPTNTYTAYTYTTDAQKTAYCLLCHDGSGPAYAVGATYVPATVVVTNASSTKSGANAARAHWSSSAASSSIDGGEEVNCAECHDNHASNAAKLLGVYDPATGTNKIGTQTITANDNTVCQGCHNAAGATAFTREAGTGYPIEGRWPGMTVYNGANGIHKNDGDAALVRWSLTYADGDCKNCHDVHGTANTYDELRGTYTRANFGTCFTCHDGSVSGATNIKQFYPTTNGGSATQAVDTYYGHKIQTTVAGGLTAGDGLPCYDCHNPHGNANSTAGLLVVTNVNGAQVIIGDAANEIDTSTAAGERHFCFSCHTGQTASGVPQLQSATNGTAYANIASGTYEGISRVTGTALVLPGFDGHYTTLGTQDKCTSCHGASFGAGANNVHNPSAGVSNGGLACNTCHSGHATMTSDTSTYHHVLDGTTPYRAPNGTATYPTSTTALECVSCHVDHDQFNTAKGSNLRTTIVGTTGVRADSDFPGGGTYGICVSCHATAITSANMNETSQKPGVETNNRAIGAISGANFDASAHDYLIDDQAKIGYGSAESDTFKANCTKCHDDDMDATVTSKMKSTYKIGTHKSSDYRIANALGATVTGGTYPQTEESLCFKCHDGDSTNDLDGYGIYTMSDKSQDVRDQFAYTSRHNVANATWVGRHRADETQAMVSASQHIECEDCHNPHVAGTTTHTVGVNDVSAVLAGVRGITYTSAAENTTNWDRTVAASRVAPGTFGASPTTATKEYQICLRCHSSQNTNVWSWGTDWTDVALEFNTGNSAYHPVFGSLNSGTANLAPKNLATTQMWSASTISRAPAGAMIFGSVGTQTMYCSDCHGDLSMSAGALGPHGSTARRVLKGYYPKNASSTSYTLSMVTAGTANDLLCLKCHPITDGAGSYINKAHAGNPAHQTAFCTECHIARPHGGKISRLIVDNGGDGVGGAPATYLGTGASMAKFTKKAAASYVQGDCTAVDIDGQGCTKHTGGTENW